MSKSPFYKVTVHRTGRDLTEYIDSFAYEDCTEEDDILKIVLKNKDVRLLDDSDLLPGVELIFMYGFIGERTSPRRLAKISTVEARYGKSIDVTVTATDAGYALKKDTSDKVWQNVTASQIAEKIALKNGLTAQVTPTQKVYQSLPQGNRTDMDFLKYLTSIEEIPGLRVFIKDNVLRFDGVNLGQASSRTFVYGGPDGNIISFAPKVNQNTKTKGAIKSTATGVDPMTGQTTKSVADGSSGKMAKLGNNIMAYNSGGKQVISTRTPAQEPSNGQPVFTGPADKAELDNVVASEKDKGSMGDITATLEVLADPAFVADTVITVKGVAQIHGGNWYVTKVSHNLTGGGGYTMRLELKKNATNKATGTVAAGEVNKSEGPEKTAAPKKVVIRYNAQGQAVKS